MPRPYTPNDKWSRRAAEEGYRARSVYKLMELDERFRLLQPGMTVVDLGAAPGSWLQYAVQRIGPGGTAAGVDLQPIEPIDGAMLLAQADITDTEGVRSLLHEAGIDSADLVLSDLAPNTSGMKDIDQWRSIELSEAVLALAGTLLKPGGRCVLKVLRGADFDDFYAGLKQDWKDVKLQHVRASRDRSREVYLVLRKGG